MKDDDQTPPWHEACLLDGANRFDVDVLRES